MKRVLKRFSLYLSVVVATALAAWIVFVVREAPSATILMYHSIGDERPGMETITVSTEVFRAQMAYLRRHHYRVVPLEEITTALRQGVPIPRRTVAITFDDGYANNYTEAFPVLREYRFPATIFVITDLIGRDMRVYGYKHLILTRDMIREMDVSGLITFGSHTCQHIFLSDVENEPARLDDELTRSKRALESMTGRAVTLFCYPSGVYTPLIERAVRRAGYAAAVTTAPKNHGFLYQDIYALRRVKMTNDASPMILFIKVNGYYLLMREMRL
jgi:peptidoglycan/xylan/chitin deacetylase (PgdA/CDA1 family)